jgi:hypothetical protein
VQVETAVKLLSVFSYQLSVKATTKQSSVISYQFSVVGAGVKEHHLCRFDEQRPHRRGRGEKLYRSFYMQ